MPYDKLVDSTFLDNGLKQIADSIRAKTGTADELAFPTGMSEAIDGISGGGSNYTFTNMKYFCSEGCRLDALEYIDTSKVTNFSNMFARCNVTELPLIDTSNGTDFSYMFSSCSRLVEIPFIDTGKGVTFSYMFNYCQALTTIPQIDTKNGNNFSYMFFHCDNLTTVPPLNTVNATSFACMFRGLNKLKSVLGLDCSTVSNVQSMFEGCANLTDLYLYNICVSLTIGSGTSYGHLLTVDSLIHIIKELRMNKINYAFKLVMGAANLEKIANLYCRVLDDTTEKIDMELCESTDEGAITLSEYASLKNWTFA